MAKLIDLTGARIGRLTVVSRAPNHGRSTKWHCECDCGASGDFWTINLRNGMTRSCGCIRAQMVTERNTIHGLSRHPVYMAWKDMKKRCRPSAPRRKDYYERGIRVCERWLRFADFWSDMGESFRDSLTVERVDNDKGYEPGNCVWATYETQGNNKRNNHVIDTPRGPMTLAQAGRAFGVLAGTIQSRAVRGLTGEALLRPSKIGA